MKGGKQTFAALSTNHCSADKAASLVTLPPMSAFDWLQTQRMAPLWQIPDFRFRLHQGLL